jgi:hypothetical protein
MRFLLGPVLLGVALQSACFSGEVLLDQTGGGPVDDGQGATGGTGTGVAAGGSPATGGFGTGGPSCVDDADCPTPPTECVRGICNGGECGTENVPAGTALRDPIAGDCSRVECNGQGKVATVADDTDVPASDSNPCTMEQCQSGIPVHAPQLPGTVVAPENGIACNGVCQGNSYEGQCGLRLYSRSFPMAGAWSSTALSVGTNWDLPNAPPPNAITVAEETSNSSRLMVVRQDGANSTFYEFLGGSWKPPVPLSNVEGLGSPALASLGSGQFLIDQGGQLTSVEIAIFTTSTFPLTAFQYIIPASTDLDFQASVVIPPANSPDLCPQGNFPTHWSFVEQRSPFGSSPPPRAWKLCNGLVYEESMNDFTALSAPTTEAASPFQITGNNGSPAPGTIVAAYYRKMTNTVFMIAP